MNDLDFVLRAADLLWSHRVRTWIFGGWGEELRGLTPQREHADLDLLYPARDWSRVDALELDWVAPNGWPGSARSSSRASGSSSSAPIATSAGWFTEFPEGRHDWPDGVFAANGRLPVASRDALADYGDRRRREAA